MNEELEKEFEFALALLHIPLSKRNEILKQYHSMGKSFLQQYKVYRLRSTNQLWDKSDLSPRDLLACQKYLPWIFDHHPGYQKMNLGEKIKLIENMFLGSIFPCVKVSTRIHLVRELVRLNCEKEKLPEVPVFESQSIGQSEMGIAVFSMIHDYENERCAIAVNQKILRQKDAHGIYYLEYIYHELDHVYVSQMPFEENTPRDICASILSMRFVNQFKLIDKAEILYRFLPEEYHAIQSSYQKVSQVLAESPYAASYDKDWKEGSLKAISNRCLSRFNDDHDIDYSEEDMRLFIEDYLFYDMIEKYGEDFVTFLRGVGKQEEVTHLRQVAKKYRSIFQKGDE